MEVNSCYKVGYIAKTHGLKGEVTIVLGNDVPGLQKNQSILVEINHDLVPYFIHHISDRGDKAFVKFEDVDNPEDALKLKGCSLYLPKSQRPKLGTGEFYNDEVVGYEVDDETIGFLGKIKEVLQVGSNRLIVIDRLPKELLVPVNSPFIQSINKSKKKVKVDLPDGFLDI